MVRYTIDVYLECIGIVRLHGMYSYDSFIGYSWRSLQEAALLPAMMKRNVAGGFQY